MVPIRLALRNFLSYGESAPTLDFTRFSLACLSGKNGHGKSALLDAIVWALWGRCRVSNRADVIRYGSREAFVEYEFDVDGTVYRVVRTVTREKGGGTAGALSLQVLDAERGDFVVLAEGRKAQSTIERELLRMDYDSFLCASFILQGRADEFLKRSPAERKAILGRFLNLDRYETLARRAKDEWQVCRAKVDAVDRELGVLEDEVGRRKDVEDSIAGCRRELEERSREVERREGELREVVERIAALGEKKRRYEQTKSELETVEAESEEVVERLRRIEGELKECRAVVDSAADIEGGYADLVRARAEERREAEKLELYTALARELHEVRLELGEERKRIEGMLARLEGTSGELERRIGELEESIAREQDVRGGWERLAAARAELEEMERRGRRRAEVAARMAEVESRLDAARREVEARVEGLKERMDEARRRISRGEEAARELDSLAARLQSLEACRKRLEALRDELAEVRAEMRAAAERMEELSARVDEEEGKIKLLKEELEEPRCPLCESQLGIEAKEALVEKLEASLRGLEAEREELRRRLGVLERREREALSVIEELELEVAGMDEVSASLGRKREVVEDGQRARRELDAMAEELVALEKTLEEGTYGAQYRDQLGRLKQELEEIAYDPELHETLERRVEELERYERLMQEVERAKDEARSCREELRRVAAQREALREELESGRYAPRLLERERELASRIEAVGYDEARHRRLKEKVHSLEHLEAKKEELERARAALGRLEAEREELRRRLKGLEAQRERLSVERDALARETAGLDEAEGKRQVLEASLQSARAARDEVLQRLSALEGELARIEEMACRKEALERERESLARAAAIYKTLHAAFGRNGIQSHIIEHAVPEIEQEANELLRRLSEGTMTLKLDLVVPTQKGGERETLQIKIADPLGTRSYETFSGGEAFRIDFALRVAISKFIARRSGGELRTLIVDEGFGSQDRDGLAQFVRVIDSVKDEFDKILVITHVEELKDKFPVRIEVRKDFESGSTFDIIYN